MRRKRGRRSGDLWAKCAVNVAFGRSIRACSAASRLRSTRRAILQSARGTRKRARERKDVRKANLSCLPPAPARAKKEILAWRTRERHASTLVPATSCSQAILLPAEIKRIGSHSVHAHHSSIQQQPTTHNECPATKRTVPNRPRASRSLNLVSEPAHAVSCDRRPLVSFHFGPTECFLTDSLSLSRVPFAFCERVAVVGGWIHIKLRKAWSIWTGWIFFSSSHRRSSDSASLGRRRTSGECVA